MTRIGETVVVPTRRTWIRCGMSEPVTKTSCSETFSFCFEVWLAGVSASVQVTDRRNRDAITGNISVFTPTKYTERVSSAIWMILPTCTWPAAEDGGSYNAAPITRGCQRQPRYCSVRTFSSDVRSKNNWWNHK